MRRSSGRADGRLEDLHWSDYATLDLLALLARRRTPARLFVLGPYRPVEAIVHGHQLRTVTQELRRHGHSAELPLAGLSEVAVAAYLAPRYPGHRFPETLGQWLYQRTDGNPLFLVTLLAALVARGVLAEQDGRWTLVGAFQAVADQVPEGLRPLLEQQLERLPLAAAAVVWIVCLSALAQASSPVRFGTEQPGIATEDEKLLIALPLVNLAEVTATHVQVSSLTLRHQQLLKPTSLPLSVGDIPAGKDAVLQLAFHKVGLVAGRQYVLRIKGTSLVAGKMRRFHVHRMISLPQPDEGEHAASHAAIAPQRVEGGGFPPHRSPRTAEEIEARAPLLEGKLIDTLPPNNPSVKIGHVADGPVTFVHVGTQEIPRPNPNAFGYPWDPSGASVDILSSFGFPTRIVFLSGNLYLLLSTDGGATFTVLDPTTFFGSIPLADVPQPDLGFCCDQNLTYIPSINRFVLLMMPSTPLPRRARRGSRRIPLPEGGWRLPRHVNGCSGCQTCGIRKSVVPEPIVVYALHPIMAGGQDGRAASSHTGRSRGIFARPDQLGTVGHR